MRSGPTMPTRPGTLSETWYRARFDPVLTARSHAEDLLFRYYLPLAKDRAERHASIHGDLNRALPAAEVALARAILDWRHSDCTRFESFARLAIDRSLCGPATGTRPRPPGPAKGRR